MPTRGLSMEDMCKYRNQGVECRREYHNTLHCRKWCGWNPEVEAELIAKQRVKHEQWLKGE